jgi:hypothetical protein
MFLNFHLKCPYLRVNKCIIFFMKNKYALICAFVSVFILNLHYSFKKQKNNGN